MNDKPKRGRPRPLETIERDAMVHQLLLTDGRLTRNMIVEKTGLPESQVYLSLSRLRGEGKAVHEGGYKAEKFWSAAV